LAFEFSELTPPRAAFNDLHLQSKILEKTKISAVMAVLSSSGLRENRTFPTQIAAQHWRH
jgi:hypothetical protein